MGPTYGNGYNQQYGQDQGQPSPEITTYHGFQGYGEYRDVARNYDDDEGREYGVASYRPSRGDEEAQEEEQGPREPNQEHSYPGREHVDEDEDGEGPEGSDSRDHNDEDGRGSEDYDTRDNDDDGSGQGSGDDNGCDYEYDEDE